MIVPWLVYGLAVSLLVGMAAWLAEQGAKARRWPTRWIWGAALAASIGLPVWAWLAPSAPGAAPSVMAAPTALVLESIPLRPGPASNPGPDPAVLALAGWAVLSVLLLGAIAVLAGRLSLRRRGWRRREVDGVTVWVSRSTGPAALGVVRGHVVVPEWALELEASRRRLLVLHEAEHVRARDPQLALAGLVLCALVPWNLPLWWQLRRLRLAIEVDCDERVIRRAGDARGYGSLLLEVCQRKAHLALALAESPSMLERRIRMITKTTRRPATLRAVVLAAVAGLVLAVACETPPPTGPAEAGSDALDVAEVRSGIEADGCQPTWLVDGARSSDGEVSALESGEIESVHVFSADHIEGAWGAEVCAIVSVLTKGATVDEKAAARRLVERLAAEQRAAAGQEEPATARIEEVRDEPTFTPMTSPPGLRNPDEAGSALEAHYPPLLKDAGIGGTVNVWFLIDEEGEVRRTLVNRSSGYDALDAAALRVAGAMRFTPAYNRDRRVPVWIALDIRFDAGAGAPEPGTEPAYRAREEPAAPTSLQAPEAEEAPAGREEPMYRTREVGEEPDPSTAGPPPGEFTPMTERPRLSNPQAVQELQARYYPPLLKDAGIGGTVTVWAFIDETGSVREARLNASSGHDALDAAALRVVEGMEFTPAMNRGARTAVWVALPVTFEAQ